MNDVTSLLETLAAATRRLPEGVSRSICACCTSVLETYRAAWREPVDKARLEALHGELAQLFRLLYENGMYTHPSLPDIPETKPRIVLPSRETLCDDFHELKTLSIMNRNGVGELPLMYTLLLMCRALARPDALTMDRALLEEIGEVIFLRVPAHLEVNLRSFSRELKIRYEVTRALYAMGVLGLLNDAPVEKPTPKQWADTTRLFTNGTCLAISPHIPKIFRLPFDMLQCTFAMERFARAGATLLVNPDEKPPREVFKVLRSRLRDVAAMDNRNALRNKRLLKLGLTTLIRFMSYMEPELGRSIYKFLRHGDVVARVRHAQMFASMKTNAERLRFMNFLHAQGVATPKALRGRFQKHFRDRKLLFSSDRRCFELEAPAAVKDKQRRRTIKLTMAKN